MIFVKSRPISNKGQGVFAKCETYKEQNSMTTQAQYWHKQGYLIYHYCHMCEVLYITHLDPITKAWALSMLTVESCFTSDGFADASISGHLILQQQSRYELTQRLMIRICDSEWEYWFTYLCITISLLFARKNVSKFGFQLKTLKFLWNIPFVERDIFASSKLCFKNIDHKIQNSCRSKRYLISAGSIYDKVSTSPRLFQTQLRSLLSIAALKQVKAYIQYSFQQRINNRN